MRDEWVDKSCHGKYLEAELHKRKLAESGGIVNCTKERHVEVIVQRGNMNESDENNRNDCASQVQRVLFANLPIYFNEAVFRYNAESNQMRPDSYF